MAIIKRDDIVAAPIVGGVVAVFAFFVLYQLAGLGQMDGDIAGISIGLFISLVLGVVAGAAVFGELLAKAITGK